MEFKTEINKILIAGAGTMGYTIAEIFADQSYDVTIYDVSKDALAGARKHITTDYDEKLATNIKYTDDTSAFENTDLVIETIIENEQIKKEFYKQISPLTDPTTIIATNTSGISINKLAEAVTHPERFVGMHWFNPSNLVLLIEIIKGDATNNAVAQTINELCLKIGKRPVIVKKDVPGFVANRIQFTILREVLDLIEKDVIDPEGVDDIMKYGLGFRYACAGPLEIADFGGLDTFYHISDYLMEDLCSSPDIPKKLADLYENNNLGVKTGKGFYDYSEGKAEEAVSKRNKNLNAIFDALYNNKI